MASQDERDRFKQAQEPLLVAALELAGVTTFRQPPAALRRGMAWDSGRYSGRVAQKQERPGMTRASLVSVISEVCAKGGDLNPHGVTR